MVRTFLCAMVWLTACADGTSTHPASDATTVPNSSTTSSSSSSSSSSRRPGRARQVDEWSRGSAAVLHVDPASFKMTVSVSGSDWLVGLPPRLYCNGSWAELRAGKAELTSTVHPRFGSADRISLEWQVGNVAGQVYTTTVLYSNETDSFLFEQQYPAAGCINTTLSYEPTDYEWDGATLPLSQFPRWNYETQSSGRLNPDSSQSLGYLTWEGRFSNDNSGHGVGLTGFKGGVEGGPLVLFDLAGTSMGDGSALVLSAGSQFMEAIWGLDIPPTPLPACSGPVHETCAIEENYDYEGHDLYQLRNVTDPSMCCVACVAESHCNAWSWLNQTDYTDFCALKTSSAGRIRNQGHTSGSTVQGGCNVEHDTDFEGNDLAQVKAESAEACCNACIAERNCAAWTWLNYTGFFDFCALKTSSAGRKKLVGHTSGSRCARNASSATTHIKSLAAGLHGHLSAIPAGGVTVSFVLSAVKSGAGISSAMDKWGRLMRGLSNTTKLPRDPVTTKLGYWTDNGGYFFGGNVPNTSDLARTQQLLRKQGVPTQYMQLDPYWWKDLCEMLPGPEFGNDPDFQKLLGAVRIPLLIYSSYLCGNVEKLQQQFPDVDFILSSSISDWNLGTIGLPAPADSRRYYDQFIGQFDKSMPDGVPGQRALAGFEVDFMDMLYLTFPNFTTTLGASALWTKGMNDAMLGRNLSIQYCMGLPSYMMQSLEYSAVTSARARFAPSSCLRVEFARAYPCNLVDSIVWLPLFACYPVLVSEDNFPGSDARSGRWEIGSTSLLLHSLAIRPFVDVIWTREQEEGMNGYPRGRDNIMLQAAVAALSAGPVGLGDGPGDTNGSLVARIAAMDGTLLSPSRPATPIDAMYAPDWRGGTSHAPRSVLWCTHSQLDSRPDLLPHWYTLLAVGISDDPYPLQLRELWPAPAPRTQYVASKLLDSQCHDGATLSSCLVHLDSRDDGGRAQSLAVSTPRATGVEMGIEVYHLAPVLSSGWCVLGEPHKFVAASPRRITMVADETSADGPTVSLVGGAGENVTILFAPLQHEDGHVVAVTATLGSDGKGTARPPK